MGELEAGVGGGGGGDGERKRDGHTDERGW